MSIKERIAQEIADNKIMVYMKGNPRAPQCGFSAAVVQVFDALGVPYESRDVLSDPELREGIKQFSNWPTIPQVFIKGEFVGGCDITVDMYKNGELKKMVADI